MKKTTLLLVSVTVCGALSPTGVNARLNPNGGGPIIDVYHTDPPVSVERPPFKASPTKKRWSKTKKSKN